MCEHARGLSCAALVIDENHNPLSRQGSLERIVLQRRGIFQPMHKHHHEYVFLAISIIMGLAITRLLHSIAILIRLQRRAIFHRSTSV